jgi:hypothetical protein
MLEISISVILFVIRGGDNWNEYTKDGYWFVRIITATKMAEISWYLLSYISLY